MRSVLYAKLNNYVCTEGPYTDPEETKIKTQEWKKKGGYFAVTVKKKVNGLPNQFEYFVYTKKCKIKKC